MFLLGLENTNYSKNENVLNDLENWLDKNYPGLSRGIYKKEGPGVNGVYNQDFSSNCILIEVGGHENTTEEVTNTIEVIARMLYEYIGDKA
jgi:stage II sporulation protein P